MNLYEFIIKSIPWLAAGAVISIIASLVSSLNKMRQKQFKDEISSGESKIDESFKNITDDELVAKINDFERSIRGPIDKKE